MKKVSRRDFLKGIGTGGAALSVAGTITPADSEKQKPLKTEGAEKTTTICPYCSVGCGIVVSVKDGKVIATEGDSEHPINRGALCSKGSALRQISADNNPLRLSKVQYRAPGSDRWEEKPADWAISELAKRMKESRDKSFTATADGVVVNRTEKLASVGAAALDNEECYLIAKLMRSMGLTYLEHQARLCHSSTVGALAPTFGRGAMTNHWIDIKNSDVVFIVGSNPAENHPVSFKWITAAMDNGGKLIVADPRFTRSASKADHFVAHRPGTDIALIGGMINYCLENNLWQGEYVREYTNAANILKKDFAFNDGIFSGYDPSKRGYDAATWDFEKDGDKVRQDKTLKDANTVFQFLKRHYSRYTPKKVAEITGVAEKDFIKLCEIYCSTGRPDKAGTILYAMGATQHTVGVQYIRSYAVLQLLLGNMGVAGGGINAMRGESNVQGSTDMAVLTHLLPGYNPAPTQKDHPDLKTYLEKEVPKTSYWSNRGKFLISNLKAWYPDASKENDFRFDWLPKAGGGHKKQGYSMVPLMEAAKAGELDGILFWGMNSAVSSPDSNGIYEGLAKLKWMAAFDLWETDTSVFWKRPGADTASIQTEVFLFPAASSFEKEGSIANSGRWTQWRYKAIDPPGEARDDLQWLNLLGKELKKLYAQGGVFPDPVLGMSWDYGEHADVHKVAKEINGYDVATGAQLKNFTKLMDDGTTACGCWIYSGQYPGPDKKDNAMAKRGQDDPTGLGLYPNWSFAWPVNRRIIYNRCSMDPAGRPYNPAKVLVAWDPLKKDWIRNDVPDFGWKDLKTELIKPPADSAKAPFLMNPSGLGHLFVAGGKVKDGPVPEHYEPVESPVKNALSGTQVNPACALWDVKVVAGDGQFPLIATTMRLTNHWQAGAMTRNLPWLAEIAPEMYVEVSHELAAARGIENGDWVKVTSPRGEVPAKVMVTSRLKAYNLGGKVVEVVAMPFHFGYNGYVTGGPEKKNYAVNQITHKVGDANTRIPEYKVFMCDIVKA
ncbi:MAG TPA: formate dehydrogenase-N subunit alpha [Nitrospirota bacterium]|nr:formate dehydrogenase-N subunit alpha [Nitrospirota bacterium]